jgi:hypothetical protein
MAIDVDSIEYRVVLVDPRLRGLITVEMEGQFRLLRVSIAPATRLARQLQLGLEHTWGVRGVVLDLVPFNTDHPRCAVAELLTTDFATPLRVVCLEEIASTELSDEERTALIAILRDAVDRPVSRLGWIDEALAWLEQATGLRACPKASVEQYNAGRGFALVRFRTQVGRNFWLKATWFPNQHEPGLTRVLSQTCPRSLPTAIAFKTEWNAWLMVDETCASCALSTEPCDVALLLRRAVRSLAELQSSTMGMEASLFAAGGFDQRIPVVRADADLLFAYLAEAMRHQTSLKVARIESGRLREMQQIFEEGCISIESLDIPSTIVHGDMNIDNLVFVNDGCQFLDWSEGYVGLPFVTLQHILLLNPIKHPDRKALVNAELKDLYCLMMRETLTCRQIREGLAWMPLLAAVCALYGRGEWLHSEERHDSRRYTFARAMARHMDSAARELSSHSLRFA